MREILLTQNQVTLVDDEDFDFLSQWKWCAHFQPNRSGGGRFNVVRNARTASGEWKTILMHRVIMDAPRHLTVDHIDHDPLNNQRDNLRLATLAENLRNKPRRRDNTSGYIGVYRHTDTHKFVAQIRNGKSMINLGSFETKEAAALKYNEAALAAYGEFAVLNQIQRADAQEVTVSA